MAPRILEQTLALFRWSSTLEERITMKSDRILFQKNGKPYTPQEIQNNISTFPERYNKATAKIIRDSVNLDRNGGVFVDCSACILISFKMTRSGPFRRIAIINSNVIRGQILRDIWAEIGDDLMKIHKSVFTSGFSRDRYLLEINQNSLSLLRAEIWRIFKRLLPFTMTETRYGLVGASKILFSVLPEIVLPVDTEQWLKLFQTVDIGDIIERMVSEIEHWENVTGNKLNQMDPKRRLLTLPSVYNIMAMAAKP